MRSTTLLPTGLRSVCLLAALVPFATGFAQGAGFSPVPETAPATGESAPPQQVGQPATDIQGIDGSGSAIRLSQFKGKVILLDVSAMWCFCCQQDAPAVQ
jgi:thiol:disulfide interchange protein